MVKSRNKNIIKKLSGLTTVFCLLFLVITTCDCRNYTNLNLTDVDYTTLEHPVPEALHGIADLAIECLANAWNLTEITALALMNSNVNASMGVSVFWRDLKLTLTPIHTKLKLNDRRIIQNKPSTLMNKVLDLQDLGQLQTLSRSRTENPIIKWRVKWIELSTMATHIHRLYNKRMRDILNDEPYIQTVATSVQKYMGTPWFSKLSGNDDPINNFRQLIKSFPGQIRDRMRSVSEGDLFVGLRKLIDDHPTAKSSSAVESGECLGSQEIGKVIPSQFEGPIYVLYYMAMMDIKYYILMSFFHIYKDVYESIKTPEANKVALATQMKKDLKIKIDMFNAAFKDAGNVVVEKQLTTPVESGYFRCDPSTKSPTGVLRAHEYRTSYIKVTNFLKVFVAPEKAFRASETCRGTCDLFDGTKAPCNATDAKCIAEFQEDCFYNPDSCAGFRPPCPVEDTICINSGTDATYCPSKRHDRVLEWTTMNEKNYGGPPSDCSLPTVSMKGFWEMEYESVVDTPAMCEICMCHCYSPIGEDTESIRTFSLKPALSSVPEDRIVVGIKFEQVDDQIHFMIAEAKALPNYQVDMSTTKWRKPKPALLDSNPPQAVRLRRNLRIVHLDDLVAPPEHVVTGVRWIVSSYEGVYLHEYIGIEIQVTKINVKTGKLIPKTGQWIGNNNSTMVREPYNYMDPGDPVKADGPALPDSSRNQFLTFRATSVEKDLGQNTIPYFDSQRIILDTERSGWLKGLGLFHKARPSFGGFLAMKLIKYQDSDSPAT